MRYQRALPLTLVKPQCGCRHFVSPSRIFAKSAKSKLPSDGWTMENFSTQNGAQLIRDMEMVQRAAKAKGARMLTKSLTLVMRNQINYVLELVSASVNRYAGVAATRGAKASTTITMQAAQHGELWAQALNDAFRILGREVEVTMQPAMQSVADDILEKNTTLLTGGKPSVASKRVMQQSVNEIARQVTRINTTTQTRLARVISDGIDAGLSPAALMEDVRNKIPQIATNRVPTIVRTEMGRVADKAAVRSMKDSNVVTHVSVTGCEAIEPGIPTFRGVPTCNIKNVPIEYSGDLQFHINHTGAIIASAFRQSGGGTPNIPLKEGTGIGTWEDRGRPVPSLVKDEPPKPTPPQALPPVAPLTPTPKPPKPVKPTAPVVPVSEVIAPVLPTVESVVSIVPTIEPPTTIVVPAVDVKPTRFPNVPDDEVFDKFNDFLSKFLTPDSALVVQSGLRTEVMYSAGASSTGGSRVMQVARSLSDEKPTFLSREEFLSKSKDMHPIGHFDRGVNFEDPIAALKKGKAWQGGGVYGDGYYHQIVSHTVQDTLEGKISNTATSYAGFDESSQIMAGFLSKEAKVIDYHKLLDMRDSFREYLYDLPSGQAEFAQRYYKVDSILAINEAQLTAIKPQYEAFSKLVYLAEIEAGNPGSFARLAGYDAIHVKMDDYLVVVNNRHYNLLNTTAKRTNQSGGNFQF